MPLSGLVDQFSVNCVTVDHPDGTFGGVHRCRGDPAAIVCQLKAEVIFSDLEVISIFNFGVHTDSQFCGRLRTLAASYLGSLRGSFWSPHRFSGPVPSNIGGVA